MINQPINGFWLVPATTHTANQLFQLFLWSDDPSRKAYQTTWHQVQNDLETLPTNPKNWRAPPFYISFVCNCRFQYHDQLIHGKMQKIAYCIVSHSKVQSLLCSPDSGCHSHLILHESATVLYGVPKSPVVFNSVRFSTNKHPGRCEKSNPQWTLEAWRGCAGWLLRHVSVGLLTLTLHASLMVLYRLPHFSRRW